MGTSLLSFDAVIGHSVQVSLLRRTLRSGRVGGAYLFAGPPGVGKTTVALTFAAAMNCLHLPDDACGTCSSCRKIANGNHPDVRVFAPEGATFKVDQVRDVQRQASWKPLEGRYKVFILLEVERMRPEGANALLKTLEEPPGDAVLILVTSNVNALLSTVRSRCQLVKFLPVPFDVLASGLEARGIPKERAREVALLSQGRVGEALEWAFSSDAPSSKIPEMFSRPSLLSAFRLAEEWQKRPEQLDSLLTWYRDILRIRLGAEKNALTHPEQRPLLEIIARKMSLLTLRHHMKAIMEAQGLLRRNLNPALTLESLALRLIQSFL